MSSKKCPKIGCENYISGRECKICGTVPYEEETATCTKCGEKRLKKECDEKRKQDNVTAKWSTIYKCYKCK